MADIAFKSARQLARAVRARKIGCLELLDHYLARVERFNTELNAIVATDIPRARKRARAADRALANAEVWGPLHGVPMTVKECHDMAGLPSTFGIPALHDNIAADDAISVKRWLTAGVTLFGKTNVPLLLADSQSWNEIYGVTRNPWDRTRTPGGSSGGGSAALAAGLTGIEMGTDIASSIRNPAHYCGLYGHKPSWGICPIDAEGPGAAIVDVDMSVIGPLGRSAGDVALGLSVMAGPNGIDAVGLALRLPPPVGSRLGDFKVALMVTHELAPVAQEVQELLQRLADFLRRQGVRVDDHARPDLDFAEVQRGFDMMLRAATSGRADDAAFAATLAQVARLSPDDDSVRARGLRGAALYHRDWLRLDRARRTMRRRWHEFFKSFDVLLAPVMCTAAYPHDFKSSYDRVSTIDGQTYPAMMETFWAGMGGLAYLPATVAPIGFTDSGLPVGVQIVTRQYGDRTSLKFAELLEREYQAFVPPPGYA